MKVSRKMDPLIKFFKQVISNDKISIRTRISAATRLDDLYARHLLMEEKAAARKERAEAKAAAQRGQEGANATQETPSEESRLNDDERLDAVFSSILNGGKVVSTDADDTAE